MKKIAIVLYLIFFSNIIFAQTNEQSLLLQANNYYRAKNYQQASINYDKVLSINSNNITALKYGAYSYIFLKDTQKGKEYLVKLYQLTQDPKVKGQIDYLNHKDLNVQPKNSNDNTLLKWSLFGADAIAIGYSVCCYLQVKYIVNLYNSDYNTENNTTHDNYIWLLSEKKTADDTQNQFGITAFVAGGLVAYTLADMFYFHAVFPVTVNVSNKDTEVKFVYNARF
jgi:tetratricopeptide (TPR) repeat protein